MNGIELNFISLLRNFKIYSWGDIVTHDPGSKPDRKYARRRDRQNYMGRKIKRNSLVCNILVHCEFGDFTVTSINRLTPNDQYMGRTAPLTTKRVILHIHSTNIGTERFKNSLYCPFFSSQNAVCFIMLTCLVPVLLTFYIQGVLKLKKIVSAPNGFVYDFVYSANARGTLLA